MEENNGLFEAQLKIGKMVLEQMFELIYRPNMKGVVIPLEINGYKFSVEIKSETGK
jgi:hypothetical protein